ncbi:adenylate/guanylate cyclase family protein [Mycobacterium sp. JS623]|uniref:ATP-binding protein n=1 Tax=Mycobacterium sp. JS623 TaxID=212767 RepID=UPI0002A57389|nr:adenylate/guanylate cyclase domain-containing protein [Mycobacterium sp. JS623]AGB20823.1 adenylate/guanylate cyclase family protein [Mycobacterium sp. JS623]
MISPVSEAMGRCGSCGNDLRAKARFCDVCGAPVASSAVTEYKQVTVLFVDVVGSMKLAAVLHPERLREIMNELFNRAAAVVQRYQGTLDKFTGDGLMALFGAPVALEDHALRACIAALEIQTVTQEFAVDVFRRDNVRLEVRAGLNSGQVIAGSMGTGVGQYTAVGHPVGMAQRMESAAPPSGVLCSLSTARLVDGAAHLAPVEEVAIKGSDVPVPARRLLAVGSRQMVLGRNEGAMVGRDADLDRLQRIFESNSGHLVGVAGAAGLGKSRLIAEFSALAARAGATTVLARCDAPTTTVAFRAVSRLLRAMFSLDGFDDADARTRVLAQCDGALRADSADLQILFDVMGIADADAPPLQVSVDGRRRRLVKVMSEAVSARPDRILFVLEDAHWIDAPSDEVLADFTTAITATQSMFVTTYRPEYRGALKEHADETFTLQPLSDAMAVRLVCQLLGSDQSVAPLAQRIAVAAVGNPFFVEEIVRDLADRGVLAGSRGGYRLVGGVDEIGVPATVQSVLAARIDRLPAEAKAIVNAAAVIGTRFDIDTLQALLPNRISSALADLVSAELIDQTEFIPRQRYCFRHPLVRTVAYESQLSTTRAHAHLKLASAIETRDPAAGDENAALIATHLEAAGELADAYRWRMRAAEWLRPRDMAAARAQWLGASRLADQLGDDDTAITMRIAPRTMLISTASYVGIDDDGDEQYRELRELASQAGDLRSWGIATAGRIMSFTFNETRVPEAAALARELEGTLRQMDWDAVPEIDIILIAVLRAYYANCDFDAALAVSDALLARPQQETTIEFAGNFTFRGVIEMCRGDFEIGRRHFRKGMQNARALPPVSAAIIHSFTGLIVAMGLYEPDDLVDEMFEVLRRAESFGDICGIIDAQFAYGTVLLRARGPSRDEAIEVLERARDSIEKYRIQTNTMAVIGADLATEAARNGRSDEAIDELRALFGLHMDSGIRVEIGCAGEALVTLLIDRGRVEDFADAHRIVDEWQVRRPGIPAADLWWLKSRALLAEAEGDTDRYAELTQQYLELCEKLDARGLLAEARRMVDTGRVT